jgi:hypothetical protein
MLIHTLGQESAQNVCLFVYCIFHSQFAITMQFNVPYNETNILMLVLFQSGNFVKICDFQNCSKNCIKGPLFTSCLLFRFILSVRTKHVGCHWIDAHDSGYLIPIKILKLRRVNCVKRSDIYIYIFIYLYFTEFFLEWEIFQINIVHKSKYLFSNFSRE